MTYLCMDEHGPDHCSDLTSPAKGISAAIMASITQVHASHSQGSRHRVSLEDIAGAVNHSCAKGSVRKNICTRHSSCVWTPVNGDYLLTVF